MRTFSIEPNDLQERLWEGDELVLVDIRRREEREAQQLENSVWIPELELPSQLRRLYGLGQMVITCTYGDRSCKIAEWLRSLGLQASFLAGGIDRLKAGQNW